MRLLKEVLGITYVVTVQRLEEIPQDVEEACQHYGLKHRFIPMDGANHELLSDPATQKRLKKEVLDLFEYLFNTGERAVLHCAAGIHRSGLMCYSLLRHTGLNAKESFDTLMGVRPATALGVSEWRVQLAEKYIVT